MTDRLPSTGKAKNKMEELRTEEGGKRKKEEREGR